MSVYIITKYVESKNYDKMFIRIDKYYKRTV